MNENSVKCRICLDNNEQEKMFELFNCNTTTEQQQQLPAKNNETELYAKVEYCCRVRIRKSEELPTKICVKCHDMIHFWMQFRKMCLNTQVYLESICKETQLQSAIGIDDEIEEGYWEKLYKHLDISSFDNIEKLLEFGESDSDDNSCTNDVNLDNTTVIDNTVERTDESDLKSEQQEVKLENVQRRKKFTKTMQKRNTTRTRTRKTSPTSYMCNICGQVYTKKASFTYHMSKHENLKPHECEICAKKFRQVCELKNHMRRHTGEKPYKCKYCDRHFIDRSEKHRHERVHTNTRPYVCSICNKSFMYSAILKNHSKLHSGEKSFNCLVCEKSFTLQHHLKAHLQTLVHKQKEIQYISAGYDVVYE